MIVGVAVILAASLRARCPESDVNSILRAKRLATWLVVAAHAEAGDDVAKEALKPYVDGMAARGRFFAAELLVELWKCTGGDLPPGTETRAATFADLLAHEPEDARAARVMAGLRRIAVEPIEARSETDEQAPR